MARGRWLHGLVWSSTLGSPGTRLCLLYSLSCGHRLVETDRQDPPHVLLPRQQGLGTTFTGKSARVGPQWPLRPLAPFVSLGLGRKGDPEKETESLRGERRELKEDPRSWELLGRGWSQAGWGRVRQTRVKWEWPDASNGWISKLSLYPNSLIRQRSARRGGPRHRPEPGWENESGWSLGRTKHHLPNLLRHQAKVQDRAALTPRGRLPDGMSLAHPAILGKQDQG